MRTLAPLALVALLGCSGSGTPDAGLPDSGVVDCTHDPRVTAYAPNLSVTDPAGNRQYVLVQGSPAPPARGNNTWTVKVLDSSGAPLPDLDLSANTFMPDHGHGSSVVPTVTANGDGTYAVTPLYFFMPGVWRVTVSDADGGSSATAGVWFFCVEG
ncbi:MAG: FixH family protein [Deltaproteobacteria bacterium]|nr:FixH family protein [Deltaproteobacteria bacterium]